MSEPLAWRWLEQPVFVTALLSPQGFSRSQWLSRPRHGTGHTSWQAAVRAAEILALWPGWQVIDRALQKTWYPESMVEPLTPANWQQELAEAHRIVAEGLMLQEAQAFGLRTLLNHDYRRKRGIAAWFDSQQAGLLSAAQRQELARQLQQPPPAGNPNPLYRSAFVSLSANYAVAAAIWIEFYRPELALPIHDPLNPLASLQGYEVVVWDGEQDRVLGRGVLQLEGAKVTVGNFARNLAGSTVQGCAFEECEIELDKQILVFTEASRYIPIEEDQ